jgi:glycosyltransferase involved in cell wall biosynthesis
MMRVTWARRHDYDHAHIDVFSGAAFVWAEAVAFELRRLGKPYALTLRGGNLPTFAAAWPRRVRHLLGSAVAVTAPSPYLERTMAAYAPRLTPIPNALATAAYPFTLRARPAPRLVWLRSFHAVYNPVMAVDVLAAISRARPDASLVMIGFDKGDGTRSATERRADELGVRARLTIVPGVAKPEVATQLARGDVFLNTTNADNTPLSVIEAMASGLCVVSTSAGGMPDLVRDGEDGLLVPPGDAAAMAAAVTRVLDEPALAERLSAAARARALAYDWDRVLPAWDALLDEVASHA